MRRTIELLAITLAIAAVGALHDHLTAQDVLAPPPAIVSPTYIAVPPRRPAATIARRRPTPSLAPPA